MTIWKKNQAFKDLNSSSKILNTCAIIARINKCKSITMNKKKKQDEIMTLSAKTNLDCREDLISSSLIDSYIEHEYFNLTDLLRKHDCMKEEIYWYLKLHKSIKTFNIPINQCHHIVWNVGKKQKVKIQNLYGQKSEE